jgi:hypothetical protein
MLGNEKDRAKFAKKIEHAVRRDKEHGKDKRLHEGVCRSGGTE